MCYSVQYLFYFLHPNILMSQTLQMFPVRRIVVNSAADFLGYDFVLRLGLYFPPFVFFLHHLSLYCEWSSLCIFNSQYTITSKSSVTFSKWYLRYFNVLNISIEVTHKQKDLHYTAREIVVDCCSCHWHITIVVNESGINISLEVTCKQKDTLCWLEICIACASCHCIGTLQL